MCDEPKDPGLSSPALDTQTHARAPEVSGEDVPLIVFVIIIGADLPAAMESPIAAACWRPCPTSAGPRATSAAAISG